ncbi:MAG: hypothetical protein FJ288_18550 [Planctomycetes bacterium]|nr:hypothetical protein [Planctomycetota bacterium]
MHAKIARCPQKDNGGREGSALYVLHPVAGQTGETLRQRPDGEKELNMAAVNIAATEQSLLSEYDDGAGWPNSSIEKERAFRQGFLEEARRVVREWPGPDNEAFDPFGEEEVAHRLRLRVRERYSVYGRGDAGRKTYHLGYRPGHEAPAARLRGRHHALAYVTQSWDEVTDFDTFDNLVLPAWLAAVEKWAVQPFHPDAPEPPPRPLGIEGPAVVLRTDPSKRIANSTTCPFAARRHGGHPCDESPRHIGDVDLRKHPEIAQHGRRWCRPPSSKFLAHSYRRRFWNRLS